MSPRAGLPCRAERTTGIRSHRRIMVDFDSNAGMTRRRFGAIASGLALPWLFGGACTLGSGLGEWADGRLKARPDGKSRSSAGGTRALGLGATRDAILQVPAAAAGAPLPLLILL